MASKIKQMFDELANSNSVVNKRKTEVAHRIKMLRIEHNYSHEDVAKGTNVKVGTYSNYENGYSNTPIESLVRLAMFYNVSLDYLCCRTNNKKGCYTTEENNEGEQQNKMMAELIKRMDELEKQNKK